MQATQQDDDVQPGRGDGGDTRGRRLMAAVTSRRRALARMIAAAGFLSLPLRAGSRAAAAQGVDLPGDAPSSDPVSLPTTVSPAATSGPAAATANPPEAPAANTSASPADGPMTVSQASQDDQPADAPAPEAVPTGPWGVPPIKITIPALGIEAKVEAVGQDPDGAMSAPADPDEVAWYKLGPGMGVAGNVVFAGHINWDG